MVSRRRFVTQAAALTTVGIGAAYLATRPSTPPANALRDVEVRRLPGNPIVTPASSPSIGDLISGPSVIRAPDWLSGALGQYYLYFAHHHGQYIRLAYADEIAGTWKIHEPGTLQLSEATAFWEHIASPDVHVDHNTKQIRMYFHGKARERQDSQWTGVAVSGDGVELYCVGRGSGALHLPRFRVGRLLLRDRQGNGSWRRSALPLP